MRLQLALNVRDLDEAIAYYSKMFDTQPHKQRAGYANFAIDQPPLKLVLFENPKASERLNHLGVEVFDNGAVDAASERFSAMGILERKQTETTCCHATQNKTWSKEPEGLSWEWYHITDDSPDASTALDDGTCCDREQKTGEVCCA